MNDNLRILPTKHETDTDREETIKELQRLLACYQLASFDDRKVVWAVLNKYASRIDI